MAPGVSRLAMAMRTLFCLCGRSGAISVFGLVREAEAAEFTFCIFSRRPTVNISRKAIRGLGRWPFYALLVFWSLVCLYPLVWMFSTSLKTMPEITKNAMALIPEALQWGRGLDAWALWNLF